MIVFLGGNSLGGTIGEEQLSLLADEVGLSSGLQNQSVIADLLVLLDIDHVAMR